jgi:hypothetical protein
MWGLWLSRLIGPGIEPSRTCASSDMNRKCEGATRCAGNLSAPLRPLAPRSHSYRIAVAGDVP